MGDRIRGRGVLQIDTSDNLTQLVAGLTPVLCELLENTPKKNRYSFEYEYRAEEWGLVEAVTIRALIVPSGRKRALLVALDLLAGQLDDNWRLDISQANQAVTLSVSRFTEPNDELSPATGRADEGGPCGCR